MNKTLREISFLLAAGMILASTGTWASAQQSDPTLVVPFGRNKELAPAHDVYKFPYKENYIMLPLTNGKLTEDGGMQVIVNKPIQLNKRRPTVIPLGHGAPNISPTPIVPKGFNGGNIAQPVNRPEGVVVKRIYPQQEFIIESASPEVRTYEVPMDSERTEALPSVVSPENTDQVISPERSIVSPVPAAPSETTPSTSVDGTQTAPSPYETSTPSPYETPSGSYTSPDYGTPSGSYTSPDYGTPSGSYTSPDYGSSTPSEYGTPSETSTPSDYGTPSGTSTDPYQPDSSSGTSQESEGPTSAWRSTPSNPAETYDSEVVGESPMIMTQQESNRYTNPWETQSAKPQVEETVSPVVTVPSEPTVNQNSAASPANQTRYVEVRPRRQSGYRTPQSRNSGTAPTQVPSVSSPTIQSAPQTVPQYQAPREVPAQLPPPDPNQQTPKPSGDGRKV